MKYSEKCRKRYGPYDSRGKLAHKRHISDRSKSAESRCTISHWEIDTIMGKDSKDCIVTLVERKTGYTLIGELKNCTQAELNNRVIPLTMKHIHNFDTITSDNGTEFHSLS